jgi:hypothetical protein
MARPHDPDRAVPEGQGQPERCRARLVCQRSLHRLSIAAVVPKLTAVAAALGLSDPYAAVSVQLRPGGPTRCRTRQANLQFLRERRPSRGNKTFSGTLTASGATATVGTSAGTATYGLCTGATTNGSTKTVNIGTGGASGSNTVVNIGSANAGAGGTMVINTPLVTFANTVTQGDTRLTSMSTSRNVGGGRLCFGLKCSTRSAR